MTQEFYALGNTRNVGEIRNFLDHFLPHREPTRVDYPVPENSDLPKYLFKTESEILNYLETHSGEPYGLYWNDAGGSRAQAMLFYTTDGKVIFGLANDEPEPGKTLKELADFVGATYSMFGSEQRPPETTREFIAACSPSCAGIPI
ncbi:MAG TPA: hypothetical protein VMF06_22635 [Candidatus Limnocylindria bacterium]|jgi:hypothetical protein|nr:hypothetical protein [Candidatus Limnocylindria bacterium]